MSPLLLLVDSNLHAYACISYLIDDPINFSLNHLVFDFICMGIDVLLGGLVLEYKI